IHSETMILGGYEYFTCFQILNWLVYTTMPEFHLVYFSTKCPRYYLLSHADTKYGHLFLQIFNGLNCFFNPGRISRATRNQHSMGLVVHYLLGTGVVG